MDLNVTGESSDSMVMEVGFGYTSTFIPVTVEEPEKVILDKGKRKVVEKDQLSLQAMNEVSALDNE